MSKKTYPKKATSADVSKVVGCTDRNVRNAWNSETDDDKKKPLTKTIEEITDFLNEGWDKLIKEAQKRVQL